MASLEGKEGFAFCGLPLKAESGRIAGSRRAAVGKGGAQLLGLVAGLGRAGLARHIIEISGPSQVCWNAAAALAEDPEIVAASGPPELARRPVEPGRGLLILRNAMRVLMHLARENAGWRVAHGACALVE